MRRAPPDLEGIIALAYKAGAEIMRIYASVIAAEVKADSSPVTEADREAEAVILAGLAALAPDTPVVAEEAAAAGLIPHIGERFFLVDPLDGTREFIGRTGEFTVNIAYVENGRPVSGVVYTPALGALYAASQAEGAFRINADGARTQIRARRPETRGLVALASRSHNTPETEAFLRTLMIADFTSAGSSLKFCRIAEGAADVYPRMGRTMEWDTAAGQAVLESAGGRVLRWPDSEPLTYGKADGGFANPFFVAWGAL